MPRGFVPGLSCSFCSNFQLFSLLQCRLVVAPTLASECATGLVEVDGRKSSASHLARIAERVAKNPAILAFLPKADLEVRVRIYINLTIAILCWCIFILAEGNFCCDALWMWCRMGDFPKQLSSSLATQPTGCPNDTLTLLWLNTP